MAFYDPNELAGYEEDIERLRQFQAPVGGGGQPQAGGAPTLPGQMGGFSNAIMQELERMKGQNPQMQPQRQIGYDPNYKPTGFLDALRHALQAGLDVAGANFNKQAGIITPGTVGSQKVDPYTLATIKVLQEKAKQGDILAGKLAAQIQQGVISQDTQEQKYQLMTDLEGRKHQDRIELKGIPETLPEEQAMNLLSQVEERETMLPYQQAEAEAAAKLKSGQAGYYDLSSQYLQQALGGGGGGGEGVRSGEQVAPLQGTVGGALSRQLEGAGVPSPGGGSPSGPGEQQQPVKKGKYRPEFGPSGMSLKYQESPEEVMARELPVQRAKLQQKQQIEVEQAFRASDSILADLEDMADKLYTSKTFLGAVKEGARNKFQAAIGYGLPANWNRQVKAFLAPIGRGPGGQKGNLSDRDMENMANALPGWIATEAQKDMYFQMLKNVRDMSLYGYPRKSMEPYINAIITGVPVGEGEPPTDAQRLPGQTDTGGIAPLRGSESVNPEGAGFTPAQEAIDILEQHRARRRGLR